MRPFLTCGSSPTRISLRRAGLAKGKPDELLVQAAVRANICEELGSRVGLGDRRSDLFFMGSLSLIDTMLDRPMDFAIAQLPLAEDLEAALLGQPNDLRPVLDLKRIS